MDHSQHIDEYELMSDYTSGMPMTAMTNKYNMCRETILGLMRAYGIGDATRQKSIHESSIKRKKLRAMAEAFEDDYVGLHADAVVSVQLSVIARHQRKLTRYNELCDVLFDELSDLCAHTDDLAILGDLLANPDLRYDKLQDMYRQVIGLPGRVELLNKLTQSTKTLLELERKAYWIDNDKAPIQPSGPSESPAEAAVLEFLDRAIQSQRLLVSPPV